MTAIQAADAVVGLLASGRARQAVAKSTDEMAERVAAEGVAAKQNDVGQQDEAADVHAEMAVEPETAPCVDGEEDDKKESEIEKIAMNILND